MIESKYLKDSIENIQKIMTLLPLKNFEVNDLQRLLRLSKIREYEHGEVIIREGDRDRWIYFLLSGKVEVEKAGIRIGIIDKIGEIFGEMTALDGLARSASVFAEGKTVCLTVNPTASGDMLSSDERADVLFLLYKIFLEYTAMRLRVVNEELVKNKKEIERLQNEVQILKTGNA